jgi:hypothetical protein
VSTKFVQIKARGFKPAPPWGAYMQVSDFRAIMALLFYFVVQNKKREKKWHSEDKSILP